MTTRLQRVPAPRRCGYYHPGHEVHWIQGLRSGQPTEVPPVPGRLLSVSDDGTVVVEAGGETVRLWNHEPERLRLLVAANDGVVSVQPGWSLLRTRSDDGSYCFSVCDPAGPQWRPCPSEPPGGELADLAREAGGFTVRLDVR
jgi:hypothetical protein